MLRTPGLVVNEKLAIAGRVPTVLEIMDLLGKTLTGSQAKAPRAKAEKARPREGSPQIIISRLSAQRQAAQSFI